MSVVGDRVAGVAAARRVHLPAIRAQIANWRRAEAALLVLAGALDELRTLPGLPPAIARHLGWARLGGNDLAPAITATIRDLQRLEGRVRRDTVTIGVAGAPRAGKTTLLRS